VSKRAGSSLVGLGAAMYGAMLAIALVWAFVRGLFPGWWSFDGAAALGLAAGLGVGLGLAGVVLSKQMEAKVPGVQKLGDRFAAILAGASTRDAIALAFLSAVGEEALFRGCAQEEWGLWPATILFAVVHSGPERVYLWWTASAFVFGIGLALLYEYQGGLLAPILMHFTINAINIRSLGKRGAELREAKLQMDW
jgi:uncharacterized protein